MSISVNSPSGTRDFLPEDMAKRNYIFKTITSVFEKFAFLPIETPALENIETLTGKYGDEGDQLLYKILVSRPFESKNKEGIREAFEKSLEKPVNDPRITDKALRYDLTVPFARFVVKHKNNISFPFKRYQIQPVWRADRPQKGRYREFFQCDADVIGSDSLLYECELTFLAQEVFSLLRVPVVIKYNSRKILSGLAEVLDAADKFQDMVVAIDKFEKVGTAAFAELEKKGFSEKQISQLTEIISTFQKSDSDLKRIEFLKNIFENSALGKKGLDEIEQYLGFVKEYKSGNIYEPKIELDISLARGLNYYTGMIFEVKVNHPEALSLSITGGGRYDDLTGIFGLPGVSGVGISFGIDRIYDVMNDLGLFPEKTKGQQGPKVLLVSMGEAEFRYCLPLAAKLRSLDIHAELYPGPAKIKKQLDFANKRGIPYVIVVGEEEILTDLLTLKNMETGEQVKETLAGLTKILK
jgi:histidyl-tRNA synthetase